MILVTGASGLLGSNFIIEASNSGKNLVAVYNSNPIHLPTVINVKADMTDAATIKELFESFKPEWVVHCAALTSVDWCELHPDEAFNINEKMAYNLALNANRFGCKLIYISTTSVFNGKKGNYSENDNPDPINVYAKSKLAGEIAVQEESDSNLIIRTDIYGWNAHNHLSLAEWILDRLESEKVINGFTDIIFTPILVNDLSRIILKAISHELKGIYNIAGSNACSKYEFAIALAEIFGLNKRLIRPESINSSQLNAPRPKNVSLNTQKISEALNMKMPDVESGLKQFQYLRSSGFVNKLKEATRGKYSEN